LSSLPLAAPLSWPADVAPPGDETRSAPREAGRSAPRDAVRDPERARANDAMERYARGEDRAFSELYDALAPRLRRYLLRASRDPGAADDLLQQTMLQIHRARGRFIAGAEVLPWAFAIARHLFIDSVRRRRNERRTISFETGGHEAGAVEAPAEQHGADELIDSERLLRALEAELLRLPESHRAAFELIKNEGLSIREAAEVLGATPTAVKLRAHRAYVALRSALGPVFDRT
jgi:RNA polymerase sigma-70 factor, ECF subfamily